MNIVHTSEIQCISKHWYKNNQMFAATTYAGSKVGHSGQINKRTNVYKTVDKEQTFVYYKNTNKSS